MCVSVSLCLCIYLCIYVRLSVSPSGCWVLGVGCWVLGAGCWVLGVGCWVRRKRAQALLGAGCWVLGVGCSQWYTVTPAAGGFFVRGLVMWISSSAAVTTHVYIDVAHIE